MPKNEAIEKTLYKYRKLGKQHPDIPKCELCGCLLKKDREWVCPNCGLVHDKILNGGTERPGDLSFQSEADFSKFMRESLNDRAIHKKLRKKVYFEEYHKDYYQGFKTVNLYVEVHEKLKKFCIRHKIKQYVLISQVLDIILPILEENVNKNG
ncbi:MAG: hypothetical protein ACFFCE_05770 [Promethearchaeota archaeon]